MKMTAVHLKRKLITQASMTAKTCFIAQSIIVPLAIFLTHIQRSLDSGFKERILTDDLLEEPVLDGGGSRALGRRGAGEGLDAGLPLSWDLGVREEREGGGLWRSCSRTLGE